MYQNYALCLMCDIWQISSLLDKVSFLSNTNPTICWLTNDPSLFTELYTRFAGRDFCCRLHVYIPSTSITHVVVQHPYLKRCCLSWMATTLWSGITSVWSKNLTLIFFCFLGEPRPYTNTHTHTHTHSHNVCRMKFAQVLAARQTGRWEVKGEDNE